ncbi:glyoxalase, partial [Basidiobolus meristosporus CBS 931.73]
MIIDHIGIIVKNLARSKEFYSVVFKPLGYKIEKEFPTAVCFAQFAFTIAEGNPAFTHVAFRAETREQVDEFYKVALENGAKDNGPPGIRKQYGDNYYAAFVHDPDGNNIEVVCHNQ